MTARPSSRPGVPLTDTLNAIARDLENAAGPADLARTLSRPVSIDDVAQWIRFDPHNYMRNAIFVTPKFELRLLAWRPGQSTSTHGHGRSACAFRILRGTATETLIGARDRTWTPGAVVDESDGALVHQVGNAGQDSLLSLHAYAPALPIDAPSPRGDDDLVIIGGGFAGTAVAYQVLRRASRDVRVTLVERGPLLGRGLAYGVESSMFRLNVPASRMSIDPEAPNDFVEWSRSEAEPTAFLSRAGYGEYVVERLAGAIRGGQAKLRIARGDAIAVEGDEVVLRDGRRLRGKTIVLATGIAPRIAPLGIADDSRVVDAWDECALATIDRRARVLVLGSGLTALDVLGVLDARHHVGPITVLSRRGLLPAPHLAPLRGAAALPDDTLAEMPRDLRRLIGWVRAHVRSSEERGEPWQVAIDSLRPHIPAIWRSLSPKDRVKFVRRVRTFWDVLRHRAPPTSLERVFARRDDGRLELRAGRLIECRATSSALHATLRLADGSTIRDNFDCIVRCIGPALEHAELETPLLASLVQSGRAARDPAGLGIATDERGFILDVNGSARGDLVAIGAPRRASNWETTSVPEISVQAAALAKEIIARHISGDETRTR